METPLSTGKLTGRLGPYGKPLTRRDGPYGKGRSLTGRAGVPYGSFTEKDDEEEERSLREGPVLTGRAGSFLHRLYGAFYGCPYGNVLCYGVTGRPPYGKPYGEERSLREGPVLTGRAGVLYGAGSLHREERPLITGKLTGSYGEGLCQNWAGISSCVL